MIPRVQGLPQFPGFRAYRDAHTLIGIDGALTESHVAREDRHAAHGAPPTAKGAGLEGRKKSKGLRA